MAAKKKTVLDYLKPEDPGLCKTTLRMPTALAAKVEIAAEKAQVSVNRFIVAALELACDEGERK